MCTEVALRMLVALQALRHRVEDEHGQTLAEYGLIMAVIAVAVVVGAGVLFKDAIVDSFGRSRDCLSGAGNCAY